MIAYDDPEYAITEEVGAESATEIIAYAMNMAADRKQCPAKDIVSTLVAAEDEGNLGSDEFGFFVLMLAVAGNETTRNAITHGMHAFLTHPDQWDLYKRERPATTAEEIVRWATPVVSFQRTATQDTELGGKQIRKGDRVGIFYSSANNDPEVFDAPGGLRHHPRPEPAPRLRRRRSALLPRQVPGHPGDRPDLQRDRRRDARPAPGRRPAPTALGLDQRRQGTAGQRRLSRPPTRFGGGGGIPPLRSAPASPGPGTRAQKRTIRNHTIRKRTTGIQ